MLHITNGEAVGDKLREMGLLGDVAVSADVLHEGPCPTAADAAVFRETRARYLAEQGYAAYDEALAWLVQPDAALEAALAGDEVVLGDVAFARDLRALAGTDLPLVVLDPAGAHVPLPRQSVALTPFGRDVLAGQADHAHVNGVDRWVGGVHLRGREPSWRWDAEEGVVARG